MHIYIEKEIYFKVLALTIMEAAMSKISRVGWQAGDPGDPMFQWSRTRESQTADEVRDRSVGFKAIPIKTPASYFVPTDEPVLKFLWRGRRPEKPTQ